MKTEWINGSKEEIARRILDTPGTVVRALLYLDESTEPSPSPSDFATELDSLLALGSNNTTPADVSRESIYSPEPE